MLCGNLRTNSIFRIANLWKSAIIIFVWYTKAHRKNKEIWVESSNIFSAIQHLISEYFLLVQYIIGADAFVIVVLNLTGKWRLRKVLTCFQAANGFSV